MPETAGEGTSIVPLTASHKVEDFDCGEPARNAWLCTRAFASQKSDDARTYVALSGNKVVGFHAITVSFILHREVSARVRRNAPDPISCILLAQLGVDVSCQGRGIGGELVLHAMSQAVRIAELGGGRLFAVNPARPDLEAYYARFEFKKMPATPPLMLMPMAKVRAILAAVEALAEM